MIASADASTLGKLIKKLASKRPEIRRDSSELLFDVAEKLKEGNIPRDYRRDLLDEVIPYIRRGNAGMDDELYEVANATCYEKITSGIWPNVLNLSVRIGP